MTVTIEQIEEAIDHMEYVKLGKKTTCCIITMKNGFEIIGTSACVNPDDFNLEIGKPYARVRAMDKLWELEGYRNQCEG